MIRGVLRTPTGWRPRASLFRKMFDGRNFVDVLLPLDKRLTRNITTPWNLKQPRQRCKFASALAIPTYRSRRSLRHYWCRLVRLAPLQRSPYSSQRSGLQNCAIRWGNQDKCRQIGRQNKSLTHRASFNSSQTFNSRERLAPPRG